MNSAQYEEICRCYIAEQFGLRVEDVRSLKIPNPRRPNLPAYQHQIDHYWETGNHAALYLNIANAKWRGSDKVDQPEILLLAKVRQDVGAHKAFMITSTGFTEGAIAAAKHEGIALHLLNPAFDVSALPSQDASAMQGRLSELAATSEKPMYLHEIVHRGVDVAESESVLSRPISVGTTNPAAVPSVRTTALPAAPTNRSMGGAPRHGDIGGGRGFGPITKK